MFDAGVSGGADGSFSFDPNGEFDDLPVGSSRDVSFVYEVEDANGDTDQATVTITVTGSNDAPIVTSDAAAAAGAVTESGKDQDAVVVDAGIASATGTLTWADVDTGATATWSGDAAGSYGSFVIDPSTGVWSYTLDNTDVDTDALAAGQVVTESFTVIVTDDQNATASQIVTVTITGSNDAPVVTAEDLSGAVSELNGSVVPAEVTPPAGMVLTDTSNITLANAQVEAGPDNSSNPDVVNGNAGTMLTYIASGQFNGFPAAGTYGSHNLNDGDVGASSTNQDGFYAIPNAGANSLVLDLGGPTTVTSIAIYNGYGNRTDGDYTLKDGDGNVLGGWTISDTGGATNNGVHSFWLVFDAPVTTDMLVFDTTDADNDGQNTNSYREIQVFGEVALTDSGVIEFSDVDLNDSHLVSANGTPMGATLGTLTAVLDSDTTGSGTGGQLTWNYSVNSGDVDYLAQNEIKVESFTITLDDQNGGLITKQIDVTITGSNDAPVVAAALTAGAAEDAASFNIDMLAGASDVDTGETATLNVQNVTGLVDGVSLSGNMLTVDPGDAAFQHLGVGDSQTITVSYEVVDAQDATVAQSATITITGTNDAPVFGAAVQQTQIFADEINPSDAGSGLVFSSSWSFNTVGNTAPFGYSSVGSVIHIANGSAPTSGLAYLPVTAITAPGTYVVEIDIGNFNNAPMA